MCFTLGASIAEIVSAFPTAGGLYTASAREFKKAHLVSVHLHNTLISELVPPNRRAIVGWVVGWFVFPKRHARALANSKTLFLGSTCLDRLLAPPVPSLDWRI